MFLSDTHIGGTAGSDIFQSAAELTLLLEDLNRHHGPVELVLAGDFLDVLRMEAADSGGDRVAATITRPEYQTLFATLRSFARAAGHRVVYLVGNHDAEVWWNPRVQRSLREAGLVDVFGLSYSASFASLPEQLVYCEHGNQFDPSNTIVDYANPLDTPVGARVLAWLLAPLVVAYGASEALAVVVQALGGSLVLRPVFLELAYAMGLLVLAAAVVFLISRRTAQHAVSTLAAEFPGQAPGPERYREDVAIRQLPGADVDLMWETPQLALDEVEEFLTGLRYRRDRAARWRYRGYRGAHRGAGDGRGRPPGDPCLQHGPRSGRGLRHRHGRPRDAATEGHRRRLAAVRGQTVTAPQVLHCG